MRSIVPAIASTVIALIGLLCAWTSFGAQSGAAVNVPVRTVSGLHRPAFDLPQGQIRVNLPDDLSAGDTISGTVFSEASGSNPAAKDRNSAELSGYVIEVESQSAKASQRVHQWRIPPSAGVVTLLLRDRKKKLVAQCQIPISPARVPANAAPGPDDFVLPVGGQAGAVSSVSGPFTGDLDGTRVRVGGADALLLAESPGKVVFMTPPEVTGVSGIEVAKNGVTARGPFRSIGLRLYATNTNLLRGQTAVLTAIVSGLQGLDGPAWLILSNHSPHIVAIEGGIAVETQIRPSDVRADGTYQMTRSLTGVQPGAFDIAGIATQAPTNELPLEHAIRRDIDGWSHSSGVFVTPEGRTSILASVTGARTQLDDFLRAQRAFQAEPASLLDALVRDYCFDLRDRKLRAGAARVFRAPPVFASAFSPQGAARVSIDAPDVQRFSFLQYLAGLFASLTSSQPIGYLLVMSKPDKMAIVIDNRGGIDYFTSRRFVVSVGEHTVKVASCQQVLRVNAYQIAPLRCGM